MAAVSSSSRRLTSTVALESATTTYMTHHSESGVIRNHSSDIVDRNVHNLPDFSAHHHSTSFHRVKTQSFLLAVVIRYVYISPYLSRSLG
jgi:hypothetical protein